MRDVVLYIAMSLDGYIADAHGGVDWLGGHSEGQADSSSYDQFVQTIDTVVMGRTTYDQVVSELSSDHWPYEGLECHIFTHLPCVPVAGRSFTAESPCDVARRLKSEPGKDIWVCGGASIVSQLMSHGLIDRFHVSVIPTILGDGIRLFDTLLERQDLRLTSVSSSNGIVELVYTKR